MSERSKSPVAQREVFVKRESLGREEAKHQQRPVPGVHGANRGGGVQGDFAVMPTFLLWVFITDYYF